MSRERVGLAGTVIAVGYPVLLGVTGILAGMTVILAVTPLNELPDTYCERLYQHAGGGCADVTSRRLRWVLVVLAATVVLAVIAVLTRRAGRKLGLRRPGSVVILVLLPIALALGWYATWRVTNGDDGNCGSTLSRVDSDGSYDPDRPRRCAPVYAAARTDAWQMASLSVLGLTAAGTVSGLGRGGRRISVDHAL